MTIDEIVRLGKAIQYIQHQIDVLGTEGVTIYACPEGEYLEVSGVTIEVGPDIIIGALIKRRDAMIKELESARVTL